MAISSRSAALISADFGPRAPGGVSGDNVDNDVGIDENHILGGVSSVRRRSAHQREDFVGGHLELAGASQSVDEPLAARLARAAPLRFHKTHRARFDFERDIRARHQTGPFAHLLGDGHLPLGGDSHCDLIPTALGKNGVSLSGDQPFRRAKRPRRLMGRRRRLSLTAPLPPLCETLPTFHPPATPPPFSCAPRSGRARVPVFLSLQVPAPCAC